MDLNTNRNIRNNIADGSGGKSLQVIKLLVTKYIYSCTALQYNSEVIVLYFLLFDTYFSYLGLCRFKLMIQPIINK